MGEGDKRRQRRTAQHGAGAPTRTSEKPGAAETAGDGTEPPVDPEAPRMPRTTTLDDPLTTSLLAEVARRSRTIDVSPEQIAEATEIEPAELAVADPAGVARNAGPGRSAVPGPAPTAPADPADPARPRPR